MSRKLVFEVQGSADIPYTVTLTRTDRNLTATCTCKAGTFGQQCKHRINLLLGDVTKVVAGADQTGQLADVVAGTDVDAPLQEFVAADQAYAAAKTRRDRASKRLAAAFKD